MTTAVLPGISSISRLFLTCCKAVRNKVSTPISSDSSGDEDNQEDLLVAVLYQLAALTRASKDQEVLKQTLAKLPKHHLAKLTKRLRAANDALTEAVICGNEDTKKRQPERNNSMV